MPVQALFVITSPARSLRRFFTIFKFLQQIGDRLLICPRRDHHHRIMINFQGANRAAIVNPGVTINGGSTYSNAPQAPMDMPAIPIAKAVMSAWYGNGKTPHGSDLGDPLACLWLGVLTGDDTPRSYVCPSDPIATTPSEEYKTAGTDSTPQFQPNFGVIKDGKAPNSDGHGESQGEII